MGADVAETAGENREYHGRRAGGHPVRLVCVHGLYHHFTLKGEAFHVGSTSKISRIKKHRENHRALTEEEKAELNICLDANLNLCRKVAHLKTSLYLRP